MVDIVKGDGRASPTLTMLGYFFHHDKMYSSRWQLPLCVFSVLLPLYLFTPPFVKIFNENLDME
jgi:hypothetical protein